MVGVRIGMMVMVVIVGMIVVMMTVIVRVVVRMRRLVAERRRVTPLPSPYGERVSAEGDG